MLRLAALRGLAELVERFVVERFAVERLAAGLRAVDERVEPVLADFARVDRFAVDFLAVDFFAVERFAVLLRAGLDAVFEPVEAEVVASIDHLPDITRCAASATASAMIEPSLVALDIMLLAACDAVSAASSPASRIFLRAAGLALIAAAAAASPAASISLLIAALASLSTVLSPPFEREADELAPDLEELEREELLRAGFAIFYLPRSPQKTLQGRSGSRMMPEVRRFSKCKGHRRASRRCPSTWSAAGDVAVSSAIRAYEHPFPTSLLNHETSDHLLSLR